MRWRSRGKSMRGSDSRRRELPSGPGGVQGVILGSGIIVRGMPRLKKVAGVNLVMPEVCSPPSSSGVGVMRRKGSDEDIVGLSVRRL